MPAFSTFKAIAGKGAIAGNIGNPFLLVNDWTPDGNATYWAMVRYHTDGAVLTVGGNTSETSPTVLKSAQGWHDDFTAEGVSIPDPGAYDIRYTKTFGDSFNAGDSQGVWVNLSVNRGFGYTSSGNTFYGEFTIEIRDASTLSVLATRIGRAVGITFF